MKLRVIPTPLCFETTFLPTALCSSIQFFPMGIFLIIFLFLLSWIRFFDLSFLRPNFSCLKFSSRHKFMHQILEKYFLSQSITLGQKYNLLNIYGGNDLWAASFTHYFSSPRVYPPSTNLFFKSSSPGVSILAQVLVQKQVYNIQSTFLSWFP